MGAAFLLTARIALPAAPVCGDVDDSGSVTTSDALSVLKKAVGQSVALLCSFFGQPLRTGQTTSFGAGDDGDLQTGLPFAVTDNADGTVTDKNTGLMWEKKIGFVTLPPVQCAVEAGNSCANPHDPRNQYSWSSGPTAFDGSAHSVFLNQLNNRCDRNTILSCTKDLDCRLVGGRCGFAGHRDWRLPNIRELLTIVDYSRSDPGPGPAVAGAFDSGDNCSLVCTESCSIVCTDISDPTCSCDASSGYWSTTTTRNGSSRAWGVYTDNGRTYYDYKIAFHSTRAVRTGS